MSRRYIGDSYYFPAQRAAIEAALAPHGVACEWRKATEGGCHFENVADPTVEDNLEQLVKHAVEDADDPTGPAGWGFINLAAVTKSLLVAQERVESANLELCGTGHPAREHIFDATDALHRALVALAGTLRP